MNRTFPEEIVLALRDPVFLAYARGEISCPNYAVGAESYAACLCYLGLYERAQGVAAQGVAERLRLYEINAARTSATYNLFLGGVLAGIAGDGATASTIWQLTLDVRQRWTDTDVLKYRDANAFIEESYAYVQCGGWERVAPPAMAGIDGLARGRGRNPVPYRNSLHFNLGQVLIALTAAQRNPTASTRRNVHKRLTGYQHNTAKGGYFGYIVIFDLQRSFPELITPILPDDPAEVTRIREEFHISSSTS